MPFTTSFLAAEIEILLDEDKRMSPGGTGPLFILLLPDRLLPVLQIYIS